MENIKAEKGSISVFVIVAFIFCMTFLIDLYWTSTNYRVTALQAEQRIKEIYAKDVENIDEIHNRLLQETEENS